MSLQRNNSWHYFKSGLRDGIPIGLGYFAVSFSLGIMAKNCGLTAAQGFWASLFTIASAGEYAGFTLMGAGASLLELAMVILVTNSRYFLMSCSMSQRLNPHMKFIHRIAMGALITDEIFGVTIGQQGYLKPAYTYGVATTAVPPWAIGTALGVIMGNILPGIIVTALSVALYGMFIAIIIPPARQSKIIGGVVLLSFLVSAITVYLPFFENISEGIRILLLSILLSAGAALLFPVKKEEINE